MSRSIHTTRGEYERRKRFRDTNQAARERELEAIQDELQQKRDIKDQVRDERSTPRPDDLAAADPASIPIRFLDRGRYVCHAVSEADLRAVMAQLPAGVLSGLSGVTLSLGTAAQEEDLHSDESDPDRDPWLRRIGHEELPGIWEGRVLGTYLEEPMRIDLYSYVVDPDLADRPMWELLMRLWVLSTFVRQIGHHDDACRRVARGRWWRVPNALYEHHAERLQDEWTLAIVVPYLEQTYPADLASLNAWMIRHGGLTLSMNLLGGSQGDGRAAFIFLASDVRDGTEPLLTRIEFARWLHYRDLNAESQCVLAGVLAERSDLLEALTIQAAIHERQDNFRAAEAIARHVLDRDMGHLDAWTVLANAYLGLGQWELVLEAARRGMEVDTRQTYQFRRLLTHRVRALLELGRLDEMEADLATLENSGILGQRRACDFRALRLLLRGDFAAALDLIEEIRSAGRGGLSVVLVAVRFEASARMGQPLPAKELPPESLAMLRRLHFRHWVARLVAEFRLPEPV